MTTLVEVKTGKNTILNYLLKPISKQSLSHWAKDNRSLRS